jgi:hypothetical protein
VFFSTKVSPIVRLLPASRFFPFLQLTKITNSLRSLTEANRSNASERASGEFKLAAVEARKERVSVKEEGCAANS